MIKLIDIEITNEDENKYPLPEEKDREILKLCKYLEQFDLSDLDKKTIELIKTQLLDNWRDPLLTELREMKDNYES